MSISVVRQGDVSRIDVGAQLGVRNREELKQLVLGELAHGARKFLVDFRGTGYIDSAGLGVLVSVSRKIREHRGELRLLNLNNELRTLFRLTLLDKMFELESDAPPEGETTSGLLAPLKPRPSGPLYGAAEPATPRDEAGPPQA